MKATKNIPSMTMLRPFSRQIRFIMTLCAGNRDVWYFRSRKRGELLRKGLARAPNHGRVPDRARLAQNGYRSLPATAPSFSWRASGFTISWANLFSSSLAADSSSSVASSKSTTSSCPSNSAKVRTLP